MSQENDLSHPPASQERCPRFITVREDSRRAWPRRALAGFAVFAVFLLAAPIGWLGHAVLAVYLLIIVLVLWREAWMSRSVDDVQSLVEHMLGESQSIAALHRESPQFALTEVHKALLRRLAPTWSFYVTLCAGINAATLLLAAVSTATHPGEGLPTAVAWNWLISVVVGTVIVAAACLVHRHQCHILVRAWEIGLRQLAPAAGLSRELKVSTVNDGSASPLWARETDPRHDEDAPRDSKGNPLSGEACGAGSTAPKPACTLDGEFTGADPAPVDFAQTNAAGLPNSAEDVTPALDSSPEEPFSVPPRGLDF